VATKTGYEGENAAAEEKRVYYYHGDHLGSAQAVTNHEGQLYERLEYTPYGEVWIEWANRQVDRNDVIPYRFTGKELDAETGLYYYGARYLDPKTGRWLSADPALGEYVPEAPVNGEARRRNGNLPGMGGVYNHVNLHVYHYAGNNPVKYVDPDGKKISWDTFLKGITLF
jgi:RHS repeat-associated protein